MLSLGQYTTGTKPALSILASNNGMPVRFPSTTTHMGHPCVDDDEEEDDDESRVAALMYPSSLNISGSGGSLSFGRCWWWHWAKVFVITIGTALACHSSVEG